LRVGKQCRFKFSINQNFVDEMVAIVVTLDMCGVILGRSYLYMRYVIFIDPDWIIILFFIYINVLWEKKLDKSTCRSILAVGPNLEIWVQKIV